MARGVRHSRGVAFGFCALLPGCGALVGACKTLNPKPKRCLCFGARLSASRSRVTHVTRVLVPAAGFPSSRSAGDQDSVSKAEALVRGMVSPKSQRVACPQQLAGAFIGLSLPLARLHHACNSPCARGQANTGTTSKGLCTTADLACASLSTVRGLGVQGAAQRTGWRRSFWILIL